MGFFIARVSGALLALVLTLLAFVLHAVLRAGLRKNAAPAGPGPASRLFSVFSAIGAAGALYILAATALNLIKYRSGLSSIVTVSTPLLLFSLSLAANFVTLFPGAAKPNLRRLALSGLFAALAAALQFALLALNLALRWNNFTHGMAEYLYIQILLLALAAINAGLFFIIFFKLKKAAASYSGA